MATWYQEHGQVKLSRKDPRPGDDAGTTRSETATASNGRCLHSLPNSVLPSPLKFSHGQSEIQARARPGPESRFVRPWNWRLTMTMGRSPLACPPTPLSQAQTWAASNNAMSCVHRSMQSSAVQILRDGTLTQHPHVPAATSNPPGRPLATSILPPGPLLIRFL